MRLAMKKVASLRSTMHCTMVPVACSLLVLFSGCSWIQTLQDNFKWAHRRSESEAMALPVMEVPVRMLYPNGTKTVDQAISYMLEPHSYRPAYRNTTDDTIAVRTFINNFNNDPVPLYVAMERLMGRDGQIILDENRKLYAFRTRKPDEAGIVFADLAATPAANSAPADDSVTDTPEEEEIPAQNREFCNSIQFRNQAMLSATVQQYFLRCGFDEVFWRLGEPGRYADYRLLRNINLPLPERQQDLIKFLQSRFGIKTLIHDDNRVEFYDENNSL